MKSTANQIMLRCFPANPHNGANAQERTTESDAPPCTMPHGFQHHLHKRFLRHENQGSTEVGRTPEFDPLLLDLALAANPPGL